MSEVSLDLDLDFLTVEERQTILAVLKRDEELRYAEQAKKRALKTEINQLRQQSAIRVGAAQKSRQCVRCHQELGLVFNKGELCPKCKHQICPNCRLTVQESSTFPWLCTLCYKQRQLPAVAGDWFYAKVEEKYKHDIQGLHGSDVIRSSIRRSKPLLVTDKGKTHSTPDIRSNPFARLPDDKELSAAVSASDVLVTTMADKQVAADSPKFVHAADRTVRRVMSRGIASSSSSSDDEDSKIQDLVLAELAEPSTSSEETISVTHVELSLGAPASQADKKLSSLSEPGFTRSSLMSHSADAAINRPGTPPESLLSPSDNDRQRSKSAIVYSAPETKVASDYTVEQLTQIKFRRCSGLSGDEAKQSDDEPELAASQGLGSGGDQLLPDNATATTNNSPCAFNTSVRDPSAGLTVQPSSNVQLESMSPNTRRRLSLTTDLNEKSPMIGRRGLDISEKFLKSFSDSSEEDLDDPNDDLFVNEEVVRYKLEMVPIEKPQLQSKLSVIKEEDSPCNTLKKNKPSPSNSQTKSVAKEQKKLKLVIHPNDSETKKDNQPSEGTPVTPGKYSSNWDEFTVHDAQREPSKTSSWSSTPASGELASRTVPGNESSDDESSSFHANSIISPKPPTKKIDRRSALRKKSSKADNSNKSDSSAFSYPSVSQLVQSTPGVSSPPVGFSVSTPAVSNSPDVSSPPVSASTGGRYVSSLIAGSFNVLGLGPTLPPPLGEEITLSGVGSSGIDDSTDQSELVITTSAEQLRRLSPDGCSPYTSNEEGAADTAADLSPVPKLSLPASLKGSGVLTQGGSDDEFDEEDIDHIVAEAKKAHKGANLSSHLTMSMESLTSMMSESADFSKHQVTGEIQYRLGYDKFTGVLTLTIHQCRDLVAVNAKKKTSDPYVKAYLLSDGQKSNKRKTKVKKSSLNPVFEETFRYTLSTGDLQTKVLQLSVWSFHRIGHGDFMGEVNIPLDSQMHGSSSGPPQWLPLNSKTPKNPDVIPVPELKVALRYAPNQSVQQNAPKADLHVKLISARNLPPKKSGAPADPFVKFVMLPEKVKHKSTVAKGNLWGETFTFPKSSISELESSSLELHVFDLRFTANELLGSTRLNLGKGHSQGKDADWMESSGASKLLWEAMINNPGEWTDSWLPLSNDKY